MLVVAVISVDAGSIFGFLRPKPVTLKMQDEVFSGCTVPPDSKESKLGSSNQEASPSASKNTGVVFLY